MSEYYVTRCAVDVSPSVVRTSMLVAGEETLEPRMEKVPVRVPYPMAPHQGSIYENQRELRNPYFPKVKAT